MSQASIRGLMLRLLPGLPGGLDGALLACGGTRHRGKQVPACCPGTQEFRCGPCSAAACHCCLHVSIAV
jgi:hypothetical protein